MEEENREQEAAQEQDAQAAAPEPAAEQEKKQPGEFSAAWHLKTLAVIYVCLGVFYILLKIFLK